MGDLPPPHRHMYVHMYVLYTRLQICTPRSAGKRKVRGQAVKGYLAPLEKVRDVERV